MVLFFILKPDNPNQCNSRNPHSHIKHRIAFYKIAAN